jgi:hypothetical protein
MTFFNSSSHQTSTTSLHGGEPSINTDNISSSSSSASAPSSITTNPLNAVSNIISRFFSRNNKISNSKSCNDIDSSFTTSTLRKTQSCSTEGTHCSENDSFDNYYHYDDLVDPTPISIRIIRRKDSSKRSSNCYYSDHDCTYYNDTSTSAPIAIVNLPLKSQHDRNDEQEENDRLRYDSATWRMYNRITTDRRRKIASNLSSSTIVHPSGTRGGTVPTMISQGYENPNSRPRSNSSRQRLTRYASGIFEMDS